jgi:hypothetical protein
VFGSELGGPGDISFPQSHSEGPPAAPESLAGGESILELLEPLMEAAASGAHVDDVSNPSASAVAAPCNDGDRALEVVAAACDNDDNAIEVVSGDQVAEYSHRIKEKYSIEHIKKYATPGKHLSMSRECANEVFQNFRTFTRPRISITNQLLDELDESKTKGLTSSSAYIKLLAMETPHAPDFESDIGSSCPGGVANLDQELESPHIFFKADVRNPERIQGQESSHSTAWGKHAFVVTVLEPIHVSAAGSNIFVWTEPADLNGGVQVLTPIGGFAADVKEWESDTEKYYFNATWLPWKLQCSIADALVSLKNLVG